jgi:deferrochelatase/peroxidase EfeB
MTQPAPGRERDRLTRRRFLGGSALLGVGAAGGAVAGVLQTRDAQATDPEHGAPVPFYGAHQAGIDTAAQDRLAFAAFDVTATKARDVQDLLREWTKASIAMCAGSLVPGSSTQLDAPPADTGEAQDLPPSKLTITAGLGPSLFDRRFGLAERRPAALQDIPPLPRDDLDITRSHGDIGIQACSNDPQVAFHAIRNLARIGRGVVSMRWSQLGFGRTSSTSTRQATPRNLMGFKDGTRNVHAEDATDLDRFVWVGDEGDQAWMRGGSYLVARRIRMRIEGWDRDFLQDQEAVIGRVKVSGAPLGGKAEFDPPDFTAKGADGQLVSPVDAHVRLAAHEQNGGLRILRRGYSFTDGTDPDTGELDAGLFFICYQKDPRTQFVPLQRKLGLGDALNEYIEHNSSAVFACPPGVRSSSDYWASGLFS